MDDSYSLSLQTVNRLSLPLGVVLMAVGVYGYLWRHGTLELRLSLILWLLLLLPAVFLHEAIHAAAARSFGAEARFGLDRRTLTPYVHLRDPLRVWQYRWQAALPTLLLGALPLAVGWWLGREGPYFFGLLMVLGGLGDGMALWLLRKAPADAWALDHPSRVGCRVFRQRPPAQKSEETAD